MTSYFLSKTCDVNESLSPEESPLGDQKSMLIGGKKKKINRSSTVACPEGEKFQHTLNHHLALF